MQYLSRLTFDFPFFLILAAFVLLASINSIVVPPFEKPDEIWHFAFVQHLASGNSLPVLEPNVDAMWRQQGGQAPAYYLATAFLTSFIDQSDFAAIFERDNPYATLGLAYAGQAHPGNYNYLLHYPSENWPWQGAILALHLARFFSIFLGVLTLCGLYQLLKLLLDKKMAILGVALWAFIPQFVFISSSASNDNMIIAMTTLLLWRLALFLSSDVTEITYTTYLSLGGLLGLALLSKLNGFMLLPLTGVAICLFAWREKSWRVIWQGGLLVGTTAFLIAGWWFGRNWWLYHDPFAMNVWGENVAVRNEALTWIELFKEWQSLEFSFWGLFGWFNIAYPAWVYRVFELIELVALIGVLRFTIRHRHRVTLSHWLTQWRWQAAFILLLWLVVLLFSWLFFSRLTFASQGRLFFPAAAPLTLLMIIGLSVWKIRGQPFFAWTIVGVLLLLNLATPSWLLHPAYQPTALLDQLPSDATPLNVHFGEQIQLVGYQVTSTQLAPSTPINLTLYWQAMQPIDDLFSVSVKGFGRAHNGELIAQYDSYPDAGRWPTTLWSPGQIIADRWRIWISGQTITPTVARLKVDLYELEAENEEIINRLPATIDNQAVTLPVEFAELIVRDAHHQPSAPADFAFRPVSEALALEKGETEQVVLDFTWQVGQPLAQPYHAFFHLAPNANEPPIAQNDFPPIQNIFPTPYWLPGDQLPDQVYLSLPKDVAPGEYQLLLGLYDLNTGQRVIGEGSQHTWVMGVLSWDGEAWRLEQ